MVMHFEEHRIEHLRSVGHLFPVSKGRRGIYKLEFAEGDFYVGQTVDVVGRLAAHRRRWLDVISMQFARIPAADGLDEPEQALIRANIAKGRRLRNIRHALGPADAACDLDWEVTPDEQQSWLNDGVWLPDDQIARVEDPDQRAGRQGAFDRLHAHPRFDEITAALRAYVEACVPRPRATEMTFWALRSAPTTTPWSPRLAVLSINTMEVLVLGHRLGEPDALQGFLNVSHAGMCLSRTRQAFFQRRHPAVRFESVDYEAAGPDVSRIDFSNLAELLRLLEDRHSPVTAASRKLNLRLMRKGPTMQWRWHCPALADHVVGLLGKGNGPPDLGRIS